MKAALRAFAATKDDPVKKALLLFLRIAMSGGLLYLAVRHVSWDVFLASLRRMNLAWFGAAFLALVLQTVLAGLRWRLIVRGCGIPLSMPAALRFSFIAAFFNQTLPASVGGDAARIWLLGRAHGDWKAPVRSIIIDRSVGGVALALMVLACLPLAFALIPQPSVRLTLFLVGIACLTIFTAVLAVGALPWNWIDRWRATRQARAVTGIAAQLFWHSWAGSAVMLYSLAIHVASAVSVWCIARAIFVPLDLTAALVLVPPVILIAMVPISIAGWGVRESAMVAILKFAAVSNSAGFLISVLFGASSFLVGMLGGLLWITRRPEGRVTVPPDA